MVVRQAQKPGPTLGGFGNDEVWAEEHSQGSSRACRQKREALARVAASSGLHTEENDCSRIKQAFASLRNPGGRCVECFFGDDADWRWGLNSASTGPPISLGGLRRNSLSCR